MNPKKFLTVILFFLLTVFSNQESFKLENFSKASVFSSFNPEISSPDYTYVEVLIDGIWWIQVFNDKGLLVDEYPEE